MTAMVIMSITAAIAYYLIMQQRTTVYRSQLIFNYDRAYQYANGATVWAESLLFNRFTETAEPEEVVVIDDILPPTEIPFSDGEVTATLEDLQGKFNFNTLVFDDSLNQGLEQLSRLLSIILVDTNQDQINLVMGSITEHIAQTQVGQLPFVHISQLRMIDGITSDIYQQILPYITVLPESTDINVNTAGIPVLLSLMPGVSANQIEALIAARRETPFSSIEDFIAQLGDSNSEINSDAITLESQYFLLTTIINIGEQQLVLYTIFHFIVENNIPVFSIVWKSIGTL